MPSFAVADLLQDTLTAPPCGENLEYDQEFVELERLARATPEQQMGNTIVPAQEPDWKQVRLLATRLLGRSKDLRIGGHLAIALLALEGIEGLRDGTALLRGLVERFWRDLHPRLDPDDDDDPTLRVNVLLGLGEPGVLKLVRGAPLVTLRGLGRLTLREIALATGETARGEGEGTAPDLSAIDAAFVAADGEALARTVAALGQIVDHLTGLETFIADRVGTGTALTFVKLRQLVQQAETFLTARLRNQSLQEGGGAPADLTAGRVEEGGPLGETCQGAVRSRGDVIRALDAICQYYEQEEPSSPLPLLMRRARRLVPMTFLDIVRDLAPEGLAQIQTLRGPEPEGDS